MEPLQKIVRSARLRFQCNQTIDQCYSGVLVLVIFALLALVVDRIGADSIVYWTVVAPVFLLLLVMIVARAWNRSATTTIEAAAAVDSRLKLNERVSTAISTYGERTPFSQAVMEEALEVIKDKHIAQKIPVAFPIEFDKKYLSVLFLITVGVVLLLTPQWNILRPSEQLSDESLATSETIENSVTALIKEIEADDELSALLDEELAELTSTSVADDVQIESIRRDSLKKITGLQKRLDELMQDEDALAYEEMRKRLESLALSNTSETTQFVADLKNGKFDKAEMQFNALQESLTNENLPEEEKLILQEDFKDLSKQLEDLSAKDSSLKSALSSAGLNRKLAGNPDAAVKAIENSKDLTAGEKKKLKNLVKAHQKASSMCEKLSNDFENASKSDGKKSDALQKLQSMQLFKKKAQMCKTACKSAAAAMCSKPGSGGGLAGGFGYGSGGESPVKFTETTTVSESSPVKTLEGAIIAKQLFEGGLLSSDGSTAAVRDEVVAQHRDTQQAIIDEEVPSKYHELLRHYFGQLEKMTDASNENESNSKE